MAFVLCKLSFLNVCYFGKSLEHVGLVAGQGAWDGWGRISQTPSSGALMSSKMDPECWNECAGGELK